MTVPGVYFGTDFGAPSSSPLYTLNLNTLTLMPVDWHSVHAGSYSRQAKEHQAVLAYGFTGQYKKG